MGGSWLASFISKHCERWQDGRLHRFEFSQPFIIWSGGEKEGSNREWRLHSPMKISVMSVGQISCFLYRLVKKCGYFFSSWKEGNSGGSKERVHNVWKKILSLQQLLSVESETFRERFVPVRTLFRGKFYCDKKKKIFFVKVQDGILQVGLRGTLIEKLKPKTKIVIMKFSAQWWPFFSQDQNKKWKSVIGSN